FYPVKVLLTAGVLWHFRDVYQFRGYRPDAITVAIGAVTFIVWMKLAAPSDELSALYSQQFEDWPVMLTLGWLLFRVLGSAITVPLAEELAFRGYLLARLGGNQPAINSRLPFSLFALVISSLLFGLLHASWIAGIFAGAAYGWARYRRGHTGDAVVAHMVTNALLCVYVLVTGSWSYW
ncbi:MAG: CAAX prenyl protease-related protein, partial [Pseudomonadota bacterium]